MGQLIVLDKRNRSDGLAYNFLQNVNVDIPIVLVSRVEDLQLNEEILKLDKYVLIDYVENGWDWNMKYSHTWGQNTDKFPEVFRSEDWKLFDEFVKNNPPVITFQRELLQKDVTDKLVPIIYPCMLPPVPIQSKEDFDRRPLELMHCWGLSHEARKWLHGKIWWKSSRYGYAVCDNLSFFNQFMELENNPRKWLTLNTPHYARQPMSTIMFLNGLSKISVSLAGAGRSCFRHSESPVNSTMLMWEDDLAWHQNIWVHNENCIKCDEGTEIQAAWDALGNPNLYEIYKKGVETVDQFRVDRYIKEYVEPLINKYAE